MRQLKAMNISSDFILFGEEPDGDRIMTEIEGCSKTQKFEIMVALIVDFAKGKTNSKEISPEEIMNTINAVLGRDKL